MRHGGDVSRTLAAETSGTTPLVPMWAGAFRMAVVRIGGSDSDGQNGFLQRPRTWRVSAFRRLLVGGLGHVARALGRGVQEVTTAPTPAATFLAGIVKVADNTCGAFLRVKTLRRHQPIAALGVVVWGDALVVVSRRLVTPVRPIGVILVAVGDGLVCVTGAGPRDAPLPIHLRHGRSSSLVLRTAVPLVAVQGATVLPLA